MESRENEFKTTLGGKQSGRVRMGTNGCLAKMEKWFAKRGMFGEKYCKSDKINASGKELSFLCG